LKNFKGQDTGDPDKEKRGLEKPLRAKKASDPDEGNRDKDTEDRETKCTEKIKEKQ
jgi:hypothetical protein